MTLLSMVLGVAHSPILTAIAIFSSVYLIWGMIAAVVFLTIRWEAITVLWNVGIAMIATWMLQQMIGIFWFQPRPFVTNPDWPNLIASSVSAHSKSFPSDHAAIAFAIATAITVSVPSVGKWFYLAALIVAVGRIAVGVHRPIDIVAGAFIGTTIALLIQWVRLRL